MDKVNFVFYVLILDVISDEQIEASFEAENLPVIKQTYSLKAARQPKETSKVVGLVHLVNNSVTC